MPYYSIGIKQTKLVIEMKRNGIEIDFKSVYDDAKIIWVRVYKKAGYILRREATFGITLTVAYNLKGEYIGDSRWAYRLWHRWGIRPEKRPGSKVCSIGYSEKDGKWYGWSHRAIHGFTVGDVAKEGDCVTTSGYTDEYLADHPEDDVSLPVGFTARTMDDAKTMAIAFADSVS